MKLSLAAITGNQEDYIERFLDRFGRGVDEVVLVRAIGGTKPDNTINIAQQWARKHGVSFVWDEYENAPENAAWPHIDNFAAARQAAWNLASGEWVVWADTDDIVDANAWARLRGLCERLPEHIDCIRLPYDIPGDGIRLMRERAVRRGKARWVRAVHECLEPEGAEALQCVDCEDIVIIHAPRTRMKSSGERNLRILDAVPDDKKTPSDWYHAAMAAQELGREDAPDRMMRALALGDKLGRPERYELAMQLAAMQPDAARKKSGYHVAAMECPERREAWLELATLCLAEGATRDALAYARIARGLPDYPRGGEPWNLRRAMYGWIGDEIYAQALRGTGRYGQADAVEERMLRLSGRPIITLVHATRGRPAMAAKTRRQWLRAAKHPERVEHIFICDADDETAEALLFFRGQVSPEIGSCVAAWNHGARLALGEVIVQLSDDWEAPQNWDEEIIDRLGPRIKLGVPAVLRVSDGLRNDGLVTLAIVNRAWVKENNGLFHPEFHSLYSDNWLTQTAAKNSQIVSAPDLFFRHLRPLATGAAPDAGHIRQNQPHEYKFGAGIFSRILGGVLASSNVPGWCDFRDLYRAVALWLRPGDVAVEVGAYLGQSVIYLAQRLQDLDKICRVVAVDNFSGVLSDPHKHKGGTMEAEFLANIQAAKVSEIVKLKKADSAKAARDFADGSLAFVFIDAAHDRASVKRDVEAWLPKIRPGGLIAGHDFDAPEVQQAVREVLPEAKLTSVRCWFHKVGGDAE